jgi:predicted DNA-binding transcriptional regulator YafY
MQLNAADRLERLEELKGLLKGRDHVTAADLADDLGVSLRTLRRDIELLRDAGIPIESDRGRGGGLRMHRNWALGRLQFNVAEAIDLLLSIAIAEQMNSPVLLQHLGGVRRKIVAAFGETHQRQIRSLRKRILIGAAASERVRSSYAPPGRRALSAVAEAFFEMRCVRIEYLDQAGAVTSREVEPHFLFLNLPVWYVLAWDRLRSGVRTFRVDRVRSVTPLDSTFRLGDAEAFLAAVEHHGESV